MATVINNPSPTHEDTAGGIGSMLGVILVLFLLFLFFYYGLPYLDQAAPAQVNVPDKIDINVNQQP